MSSKSEKYSRQCRTDQAGPASLTSGKLYKGGTLPQNPQYGNPGKRANDGGSAANAANKAKP